MRPFVYHRVVDPNSGMQALGAAAESVNSAPAALAPLAGGTTLIDLMKLDVMRPSVVVDINPLADAWSGIEPGKDGLRLGALARMSDVAAEGEIRKNYPVIADSLKLAASPQLRNMATLGGNVLQRTRCSYFRDVSYGNCNKRNPGSGCAALEGFNRSHAVLGTSQQCVATYPGDFAQALIALDAIVEITGKSGARSIRFSELHRPPGNSPHIETTLGAGELISGFAISGRWPRSVYLKARDRQSYEFALASAAIALEVRDNIVRDARVALGGVATVPWRAHSAEALLIGQAFSDDLARRAAEAAFTDARGLEHNTFKIALGRRVMARALHLAVAMEA
jgi:xanthine dehydrogenase YagS FAD-binding subunit